MNRRARLKLLALGSLSLALLAADSQPKGKKPPSPPETSTSVAAPIFSTDACKKDQDCVPAVPCHANACGSVTRAAQAADQAISTMQSRGGTSDSCSNH